MSNVNKFGLPNNFGNQQPFSRPTGFYQVPTDFVELPSQGKFYSKDSPLYGVEKLEIKYMTAREEDLLVSPSLKKEGVAIDRVIESLLVDKNIRTNDLLVGDKTAILINARKNAYGAEYKFPFVCTKCGHLNEQEESLENVKSKETKEDEFSKITENGTILITLPKSKATIELKILTSEDEQMITKAIEKRSKNNLPPESLLTRYRQMFVSVNGDTDIEFIVSFIANMPIADSAFLKKRYVMLTPDVEFKYSKHCSECSTLNEGEVPILANFFWPDL